MTKYSLVFSVLALVAVAGYFALVELGRQSDSPLIPAPVPSISEQNGEMIKHLDNPEQLQLDDDKEKSELEIDSALRLAESENRVLDMVAEYEEIKTDPDERARLKKEMKQQLKIYDENVLDVALKKMESERSAVQ